jgi:hypothetical protein
VTGSTPRTLGFQRLLAAYEAKERSTTERLEKEREALFETLAKQSPSPGAAGIAPPAAQAPESAGAAAGRASRLPFGAVLPSSLPGGPGGLPLDGAVPRTP